MNYGLNIDASVYKSQVLVVGAGGAGLAAAVAAAEKGADVILIEKRHCPGGNTALAGGLFSAKPHGPQPNDIDLTEDELFLLGMDFAHWTINPRLMRAFLKKSVGTLDWLESYGMKISQTFEDVRTRRKVFNMYIPPVQYVVNNGGSGLILGLYNVFTRKYNGRVFCNARARDLIVNEDGTLGGVIAEHDGKDVRFEAKSVIIATGGFGGSVELMKKYCRYYDERMYHKGITANVGDGLLMGLNAGAGTANLGSLMVEAGWTENGRNEMWYFTAIRNQPIWLNKRGERFVNEASYRTRGQGWLPVSWQPDCVHYNVFDQRILEEIINGYDSPHFKAFGRHGNPPKPVPLEEAEALLKESAEQGNALITDSIDEIAAFMGAPVEKVRAQIEEYNHGCDIGQDIMAKDPKYLIPIRKPPYYVIRCIPRYLVSMGGLNIDEHMQVMDPENNLLMEGLYAVGDTAGGFECECYNANLYGMFVGFAVNSGRIAGENAAAVAMK